MAEKPKSLDDVDPKLLATYAEAGHPAEGTDDPCRCRRGRGCACRGRKVAVDAVFDSVSVGTTFQAELKKAGVIFCSISEAIKEHPELVKKYLGSVVPITDNYLPR
jgi:Fe-S cluster assembly protein SufB